MISLIANTGVQFYRTKINIDSSHKFELLFHEWFDTSSNQLKLELVHHFAENDVWVKKKDLHNYGYLKDGKPNDKWDDIREEIDSIDSDLGNFFSKTLKNIHIDKFMNKWLPFPYFELNNQNRNVFGPTNWCRIKITEEVAGSGSGVYDLVIAFDTKTVYDEDEDESDLGSNELPVFTNAFSSGGKKFGLCNDDFLLIDFLSKSNDCEWIDKYILKLVHDASSPNRLKKPKLDYIASFITFLSFLQEAFSFPDVTLYKDRNVEWGNVDIAIDIGNSRTSAVLFEENDFTKVRMLELQDFSNPTKVYKEPFDMRLVFQEADFGDFGLVNSKQFQHPSFVRLGSEAQHLIYKAKNENVGKDQRTSFSSPKRYLWDERSFEGEWEYIQEEGDKRKAIWLEGVSQQFDKDGSLNLEGSGGQSSNYSPRSLMTFAFVEILSQANIQINSHKYRGELGDISKPRKINRIIVTCPTAMSRLEQAALREAAEEASVVLNRYHDKTFDIPVSLEEAKSNVRVIPSSKNKKQEIENSEWIYDEATSVQFVYLYAEIAKRYLNNSKSYFDLYGKIRGEDQKKSLIIGSLDIGAGTSDVMISKYNYDQRDKSLLTPDPIFWESFYFAGDDMLKEFIKHFIIDGSNSSLKSQMKDKGLTDVDAKLFGFFGEDHASMTYQQRQVRRDFNIQVSVPLALKYLELTQTESKSTTITFDDIFNNENVPSDTVLGSFQEHFGFEFQSLEWEFSLDDSNKLISKVFAQLLQKVASLMYAYDCDFVLLSGRPTTLSQIEKLVLKYYPVNPNRLVVMNNYRVGKWYPFQDGNGYFANQKTVVGVGAVIGNIASEQGGFEGFSLNLNTLKSKLKPTTENFGVIDQQTNRVENSLITPSVNEADFSTSSLPFYLGTKQIDSNSFPSRTFYKLEIDRRALNQYFINQGEDDKSKIKDLVDKEIIRINKSKPLRFSISRENYEEDKERLSLLQVENDEGEELRLNDFRFQVQSLNEGDNYWLDTGEFKIGINTRI